MMDKNVENRLISLIEEVQKIDIDEFPLAVKFIDIPLDFWKLYKRDIIKTILRYSNILIDLRAAMGGGIRENVYMISISPAKNIPAIPEDKLDKNIDEILTTELFL